MIVKSSVRTARRGAIDQFDSRPDPGPGDRLPLGLSGPDLHHPIDTPCDRRQVNPVGGSSCQTENLLKTRRMIMGWTFSITSLSRIDNMGTRIRVTFGSVWLGKS
jgi:hypothetical protein